MREHSPICQAQSLGNCELVSSRRSMAYLGAVGIRAARRAGGVGTLADGRKCIVHPLRVRRVGHRNCGRARSAHSATEARQDRSLSRRQRHSELAAGYKKIQKTASGIDAQAEVAYGKDVVFRVHDKWSVNSAVLSLHRNVKVKGNASGGFYSAIDFTVDPSFTWPDINFMVPGAIYGDPTYDGDRSPGGTLNYAARHLLMREDILAAPLFAMSFKDGASIAMLDPAPRGDTTEEESKLTNLVMTDARFQFGAMGAWQAEDGAVEFGFRYPGHCE